MIKCLLDAIETIDRVSFQMSGSLASRIPELERPGGRGLGRAGQFGRGDDAIDGTGKIAFAVRYLSGVLGFAGGNVGDR